MWKRFLSSLVIWVIGCVVRWMERNTLHWPGVRPCRESLSLSLSHNLSILMIQLSGGPAFPIQRASFQTLLQTISVPGSSRRRPLQLSLPCSGLTVFCKTDCIPGTARENVVVDLKTASEKVHYSVICQIIPVCVCIRERERGSVNC